MPGAGSGPGRRAPTLGWPGPSGLSLPLPARHRPFRTTMRHPPVRRLLASAVLALATASVPAQTIGADAGDAPLPSLMAPLFPDDAAWDAERQAVADLVPSLAELRGTLGRDAASLRLALDRLWTARQRLHRLEIYASWQSDADPGSHRNQARSSLVASLASRLASALAWVDPELQAIGADQLAAFQATEPGLQPHALRIRDALRLAPHTLAPDVEAALAAYQPVLDGSTATRALLLRSDIAWPVLVVDGQPVTVDPIGFDSLRRHPDRALRRQAFDAYWGSLGRVENTLGVLLAQRVQQGVVNAQLRQYPSAAAAALSVADVPEPVLRTLVAEVNQALPALHRYLRLRQRMLKLPELQHHDLDAGLVATRPAGHADGAVATLLVAVKPLGEAYQAALQQALQARPVGAQPVPGARRGAGPASGPAPTSAPGPGPMAQVDGLLQLARASGRGMHAAQAQRHQPPEQAGVPRFLAGIAPATHAVLLGEHLRKTAASRDERIAVLTQVLEQLRTGYFRPTMEAEFELAVHAAQQRGEPLSGQRFTEIHCSLLRKYHGADLGVVAIDPADCIGWAVLPHAHRPFEGHADAIGAAAAQFFGDRILAGRPGARDAYLQVLQAGASVPPHALLQRAGLDLTSPAPYQAVLQAMDRTVDELDRLLR